ncbi:hypothetical protein D3C73_1179050 [compost metagenome]
MKAWIYTSSKPSFLASSSMANKWLMWLCTPPFDSRPNRCSFLPVDLALRTADTSVWFSKNSPSRMDLSIMVKSWYTIRPAPMFRCPTSELPICPSGSPTASPHAVSVVFGYCFR